HGVVLLPRGQDPIPFSGQVHRCLSRFTAPEGGNRRSSGYGTGRRLLRRNARAHPLARSHAGTIALWQFPYHNWSPLIPTNPLPWPLATGITGSRGVTASEPS